VDEVEGLTVKGITFDGADKADTLIQIHGKCLDLKLENLILSRFKNSGIRVTSAAGIEGHPINFNRLEIHPRGADQFCIQFEMDSPKGAKNSWINLSDCKSTNKGNLQVNPTARDFVENCEPAELFKGSK
jgi:hypothetical protein